jgi:hypothetical protein
VKTFFILVKTNAKRKLKDAQLLFFGNTPANVLPLEKKLITARTTLNTALQFKEGLLSLQNVFIKNTASFSPQIISLIARRVKAKRSCALYVKQR